MERVVSIYYERFVTKIVAINQGARLGPADPFARKASAG